LRQQEQAANRLAASLAQLGAETEQLAAECSNINSPAATSTRCNPTECSSKQSSEDSSTKTFNETTPPCFPGAVPQQQSEEQQQHHPQPRQQHQQEQQLQLHVPPPPPQSLSLRANNSAADIARHWKACTSRVSPDRTTRDGDNFVALVGNVESAARAPLPKKRPILNPRSSTRNRQVFVDAEALKERVRANLIESSPYDVTRFYKTRGFFQAVARSNKFEAASFILVVFSSVWTAVDIDNNTSVTLAQSALVFQVAAHLLCIFFVLEILTRFLAFENIRNTTKDFWCMFDLTLVALFVFETWFVASVTSIFDVQMNGDSLRIMVIFRILRLLRVLRLARVLQHVPELMVIIRGIGIACRAIAVVLALLLIIVYVGAIVFRVALEGTPLGLSRFPDVPAAMGTLLLECTLSGNRGTSLMREAFNQHPACAMLVLVFVLLANVTIMGVLTGLLVQTVKTVAEVEKEEKMVKELVRTMNQLWGLVMEHDVDYDGFISTAEFWHLMELPDTVPLLQALDVDVEGLVNVSNFIFEQHNERLSRSEFLRVILDLRGSKKATVKDHMETRKFVSAQIISNVDYLCDTLSLVSGGSSAADRSSLKQQRPRLPSLGQPSETISPVCSEVEPTILPSRTGLKRRASTTNSEPSATKKMKTK